MAENSAISWTDHTYNAWEGCTKVSPACDHCYAERDRDHRYGTVQWGAGMPRRRMSEATRKKPHKWEREAEAFKAQHGHYPRVFASSLCDVFDNEVPDEWRDELWQVIRDTPRLCWMLLTKRIGNARKMLPPDWPFSQAGLMATIVTQEEFDRDWPKLRDTPATWRGISMEPLLGPIDMSRHNIEGLGWVITGGESGPNARPSHPAWFQSLRDQCAAANIPYHFKQWGEWAPGENANFAATKIERTATWTGTLHGWEFSSLTPKESEETHRADEPDLFRIGKYRAGRTLDGIEHNGFPADRALTQPDRSGDNPIVVD